MQTSKLTGNPDDNETYEITARFDNVGGLNALSSVKVAGVKTGYDKFPIDTVGAGLLGEQYIGLEPGAEQSF